MAQLRISFKRLAIDKATKKILAAFIVGSMLTVFGLVGSKALLAQFKYQGKVIDAKKEASDQLSANLKSVKELSEAYKKFDGATESVIGTADNNSKIILNALPSKYDYPALVASLEKLLKDFNADTATGTDDEIAQQGVGGSQVIEIPFDLSASGDYAEIQRLVNTLDRSIRPIQILSVSLSGDDSNMTISIKAKTFYQSGKKLEVKTKDIE